MVLFNELENEQLQVNLKWFLTLITLILLMICVVVEYRTDTFTIFSALLLQMSSNLGLIFGVTILAFFQGNIKGYYNAWYKAPLIFITFQSVIGIIQFLTSKTIFPSVINGDTVIGNAYYLHGISSSNSHLLELGGHLRAAGFTNSSLTLGMFLLLGIAITRSMKNRHKANLLVVLYSITIYMTLVRVVWLAWAILMLYMFIPTLRERPTLQKGIGLVFWLGQLSFSGLTMLQSFFSKSSFFSTLNSRFAGYDYFHEIFGFNLWNFFTGQNFIVRMGSYTSLAWSVDNQFLVLVYNLGLIGFLIYFIANMKTIKILTNNRLNNQAMASMLCVLPLIGIVNDPSYFVNGAIVIALLATNHRKENLLSD